MATSPNYNWPEPDNTDLVKNGALAIRTAVNAIDTSLAELKGGTTGQVLSKTSNTDMDFTWVAQDDSNAIQNAIVDAKGDLIAATADDTPARLAVGANDLVLTAASGEATGLKYSGGWTSWTPIFSGITIGDGTVTATYAQVGKIVFAKVRIIWGSTTSLAGGFLQCNGPVTGTVAGKPKVGNAYYLDTGVADYDGSILQNGNTTFISLIQIVNGTYPTFNNITSTVPFTWATNDEIVLNFNYQAA
jgi:hypothetical protein